MISPARPPLTREALAALAASAGLVLTESELAALLLPTAALFAALDRLDALDLQAVEPAAIFRLPAE
jgi:hypothetical protein